MSGDKKLLFSTNLKNYNLIIATLNTEKYVTVKETIPENNDSGFSFIKKFDNRYLYWTDKISSSIGVNVGECKGQSTNISITNECSNISMISPKNYGLWVNYIDDYESKIQYNAEGGGSIRYTDINADKTFYSIKIAWSSNSILIYRSKNYIDIEEAKSFNIEVTINNQKIIKNYTSNNDEYRRVRVNIINYNGIYDIEII